MGKPPVRTGVRRGRAERRLVSEVGAVVVRQPWGKVMGTLKRNKVLEPPREHHCKRKAGQEGDPGAVHAGAPGGEWPAEEARGTRGLHRQGPGIKGTKSKVKVSKMQTIHLLA